jgi:Domain of unknown function (DUF4262)
MAPTLAPSDRVLVARAAPQSFAYTIGLWHTFCRPEVVMFGLEREGMGHWLNACVKRGRDHGWPAESEEFAGVLDGFPVQLRPVHVSWHDALFGTAWRFYRGIAVPVLQLVWPDRNGVWPWQEGATASSRTRQAFAWRPVTKHPRGDWRRYAEKEGERHVPRLDALTSRGLLEGIRPVTRIVHLQGRYDVLDERGYSADDLCWGLLPALPLPPETMSFAGMPDGQAAVLSPDSRWTIADLTPQDQQASIRAREAAPPIEKERAEWMMDLSNHLAAEGQWGEALAAIEEAVTIRRQLAADQPGTFLPDLAAALSHLAHVLETLGRASEARAAQAEADAIGVPGPRRPSASD